MTLTAIMDPGGSSLWVASGAHGILALPGQGITQVITECHSSISTAVSSLFLVLCASAYIACHISNYYL